MSLWITKPPEPDFKRVLKEAFKNLDVNIIELQELITVLMCTVCAYTAESTLQVLDVNRHW